MPATEQGKEGAAPAVGVPAGRRLPAGVDGGLLLLGRLRYHGQGRNPRMHGLDIECVNDEGRPVIKSCTGWVSDQDGVLSRFGELVTSGRLAGLLGKSVVVAVSERAWRDSVQLSVEGIWPWPDGDGQ